MTLRYRDLQAVPFTVTPARRFARPAYARWSGLSISPGGEVYLTYFREGSGSTILDVNGDPISLTPPDSPAFDADHVQRFTDGRWLVVAARTENREPNAWVFAPDGAFSHAFHAGDGIWRVLIDQHDRIWIGYNDEGVFGGSLPSDSDAPAFGPNGLVRLDVQGGVQFGFNRSVRGRFVRDREISDIYALTVDGADRAWLCPYTEFYLASVDGETIDFVLERAPVSGASAIAIGPAHFAFFGGYDRRCMVTVVERASRRLRLIQLHDLNDNPLSTRYVETRGGSAVALYDDALYRLDLDVLLDALGPWHDGNSATVASAVLYLQEEASHAPGTTYIIGREGVKIQENPGAPRPPENRPRDDDCGEPRLFVPD